MTAEFNLIERYFTRPTTHTSLGIGDDAALIDASNGCHLAISTDMLVAGTHFFEDTEPYNIGWKSLAVNISDMAAMGAKPKWTTLSIALPSIDDAWLSEFSRGFFACADAFNIDLIGGDTTRGALNITVQIVGETPNGKALKRDGARAGDDIWVSGQLGSAALGLAHLTQKQTLDDKTLLRTCFAALHQPQPQMALGLALRDIAHSCIDVSDGLLADLGHILKASNLGANIQLEAAPCLPALKKRLAESFVQQAILAGGDDYVLCFTASPNMYQSITELSKALDVDLTKIGTTSDSNKLLVTFNEKALNLAQLGYDHFY